MNTSLFWTYFNTKSCKERRWKQKRGWAQRKRRATLSDAAHETDSHHFFEFELNFLRAELLAQSGFPQQHVTVVCKELRALWLRLSLHAHAVWIDTHTHTLHEIETHSYCSGQIILERLNPSTSTCFHSPFLLQRQLQFEDCGVIDYGLVRLRGDKGWKTEHGSMWGHKGRATTYHCLLLLFSRLCFRLIQFSLSF